MTALAHGSDSPTLQLEHRVVFDDVGERLKAIVSGMPGYPKFRAGVAALLSICRSDGSQGDRLLLNAIACAGDVTLFLLWSVGSSLLAEDESSGELFSLYMGSGGKDPAAYSKSIDFLRGCLGHDDSKMFPTTLLLAVEGWLDPIADAELLGILGKFRPSVLQIFTRDQQFIKVIHQRLTYALLGPEGQNISEAMLQEAMELFTHWETNGDGLLGVDEARLAMHHYRSKRHEQELARLFQDLLEDEAVWRDREVEFAEFVRAFADHKTDTRLALVVDAGALDLEFQQAAQLRSALVRIIGALQSFRRLIQATKKEIPNDALNVYNSAAFQKSDYGSDVVRYLTALGTLAVQLILPVCLYIYVKERKYNTLCSGGAPHIEQWTVAAVAMFYILLSGPACTTQVKHYLGNKCKHLKMLLRWRPTQDIPKDILSDASTGIVVGLGDPSPARRIMASIDLVMNTLYPTLISLLTLYLVYNGTSPIDMTKFVVFIHFLFQLDERFMIEDKQTVRANILLTILARQRVAKVSRTGTVTSPADDKPPPLFGLIATHMFSIVCSMVAIVSPFAYMGYLVAAPVCL